MVFGWEEERENVWWDPRVFSLGELESFFPKMGRKLGTWVDQNAHVHSAHHIYAFFFLSTCICTIIFAKKICYFFVLFNKDININLYQFHFFILLFFFLTKQISFLYLHFSILQTKQK